jgi:hypothetical protein
VVHEDLEAAAGEEDHEEEVDVVGDAEPHGEAEGADGVGGGEVGRRGDGREAGDGPLGVGGDEEEEEGEGKGEEGGEADARGRGAARAVGGFGPRGVMGGAAGVGGAPAARESEADHVGDFR